MTWSAIDCASPRGCRPRRPRSPSCRAPPGSSRLDQAGDPAHSSPDAEPGATVDLSRIAELPNASDPTPTETDRTGCAHEPTEGDGPRPPEHPAAADAGLHPNPDSPCTTDFTAPRSAEVRGNETTDIGAIPNGLETVTQLGPLTPRGPQSDGRSGTDRPEIPGYEILEQLGEGGMGVVYKARQQGLNRLVALKMIRGGSSARIDHLARFRVEAEAVAQLRHPNIVQIYDIGEVDGYAVRGAGATRRRGSRRSTGGHAAARSVRRRAGGDCWPEPSTRLIRPGSSTATSSRPTSCSPPTASPRSPTSAWPSGWNPTATRPRAARSWARPATWPPSRPADTPRTSDRPPTSTRWARSSTRS